MTTQLEPMFRATEQFYRIPQVTWVNYSCAWHPVHKSQRSLLLIQVLLQDAPKEAIEAEFFVEEYLDLQLQLFAQDIQSWLADPVNKPCPTTPAALAASYPRWGQVLI